MLNVQLTEPIIAQNGVGVNIALCNLFVTFFVTYENIELWHERAYAIAVLEQLIWVLKE